MPATPLPLHQASTALLAAAVVESSTVAPGGAIEASLFKPDQAFLLDPPLPPKQSRSNSTPASAPGSSTPVVDPAAITLHQPQHHPLLLRQSADSTASVEPGVDQTERRASAEQHPPRSRS